MAVISVANAQQLIAAVAAAKGGDVISLAPGDYGAVALRNLTFDAPVTIVSADPANPAVFDSLALRNLHNMTFASIEVDFVRGDSPDWVPAVETYNSSHLTFDGVHVHGTLNDDPNDDSFGITINGSSFVTIRNSEFEQLNRGVLISASTDVDVSNNDFHDIRAIATAFAQVQRVVVDGNHISDIYWREPDHPDAIQFLTSGTTASSSDIRITNNVIMTGDGNGMQGIFLRDEVGTLPYKNVYIGNNLVYIDSLYNGITVLHGENIQVVDNTVLSPSDDAIRMRIWMENVTNGHIEGNVAEFLLQTGTNGLTVADNLFLEDSPANAALFPNLNLGPAATVGDFLIDGYGYQPNGDSTPTPTPTPTPADDAPASIGQSIGQALRSALHGGDAAQSSAKTSSLIAFEPDSDPSAAAASHDGALSSPGQGQALLQAMLSGADKQAEPSIGISFGDLFGGAMHGSAASHAPAVREAFMATLHESVHDVPQVNYAEHVQHWLRAEAVLPV